MIFSNFSKHKIIFVILLMAIISPATVLANAIVPLKVNLDLHEQVGFRPNCLSQFGGTTTGTGNGTHLGNVSFAASDCIMPIEDYFTFKGAFILAAANGDKLMGNYGGSFVPINAGPMYSLSDATFEIKGGTGRFAQATGSGELQGTQDMTTGDGTLQVDGTMSKFGWVLYNENPIRVTGMALDNPASINEYVTMFRDFATVDPLEDPLGQSALVTDSVAGSQVAIPEPSVLVLLGIGLAALQFAQRKIKC
ncbi:MAG TPA: PEP-CTERM sorting domain-containing protein [Nitrococcus sp.]|nr:PEP-CTERM sorting domain-containing protein [Nitrococcus sp.]